MRYFTLTLLTILSFSTFAQIGPFNFKIESNPPQYDSVICDRSDGAIFLIEYDNQESPRIAKMLTDGLGFNDGDISTLLFVTVIDVEETQKSGAVVGEDFYAMSPGSLKTIGTLNRGLTLVPVNDLYLPKDNGTGKGFTDALILYFYYVTNPAKSDLGSVWVKPITAPCKDDPSKLCRSEKALYTYSCKQGKQIL
jgi:hypothetical protein